jgi:elongation factor Tu
MKTDPHIEAQIEFVTTEGGGRSGPAFSGYRPQFYYSGKDCDAEQIFPDVAEVKPGESVRALLRFTRPEAHWGNIRIGMPFLVREGHRTVAFGIITQILPEFEKAVNAARSKK